MTPLQLEVLLHYYTNKSVDHREVIITSPGDITRTPAVVKVLEFLVEKEQLLATKDWAEENVGPADGEGRLVDYVITKRGTVYCNAVLNIPLPVWRVPT